MIPGTVVSTPSGKQLRLGAEIGKGGEGRIFHVEEDQRFAIKVYTDGKELERLPKIQAMIADRLAANSSFVAFPIARVLLNGRFIGFAMRKVTGSKPIYSLYLTAERKTEFPEASYRFIVRAAVNYARAIASLHRLGAVVGDINESGALVDRQGLVTLIDADSFQYTSNGIVFRCRVGKREFTPPELHRHDLSSVDRTPDHDAFGLAVIIFHLLFLGRHPFQGISRIGDQPDIAEAILAGRFAYSPHKSATNLDPPRHMPVLTDIPPDVAMAFNRAFGPYLGSAPRSRPSAAEWVRLLESMEKNIIECRLNPAHYYSRNAATCPWCRMEAGYGTLLFIHYQRSAPESTFSIDLIMSRIEAIASPGPVPDLASLLARTPVLPSQEARGLRWVSIGRRLAGVTIAIVALLLMLNGFGLAFFLLAPAGYLFFRRSPRFEAIERRKFEADRRWKAANEQWQNDAAASKFEARREELRRLAVSYRDLPRLEREMLAALEKGKRDLQMQKHLESCKLAAATIEGIGYGRKLTLRSFGIETAWDVVSHRITSIPGFGPALAGRLLSWRRSMEQRFRFNAAIPTDPAQIAKVHAAIGMKRSSLESELLNGARDLETVGAEALAKRRGAMAYDEIYQAFRQAEEDWRYVS